MANIIGTVKFKLNKQWKYSSSVMKSAILDFYGRSASIFITSTNYFIYNLDSKNYLFVS